MRMLWHMLDAKYDGCTVREQKFETHITWQTYSLGIKARGKVVCFPQFSFQITYFMVITIHAYRERQDFWHVIYSVLPNFWSGKLCRAVKFLTSSGNTRFESGRRQGLSWQIFRPCPRVFQVTLSTAPQIIPRSLPFTSVPVQQSLRLHTTPVTRPHNYFVKRGINGYNQW
jgi:hypothetical protein